MSKYKRCSKDKCSLRHTVWLINSYILLEAGKHICNLWSVVAASLRINCVKVNKSSRFEAHDLLILNWYSVVNDKGSM